MWKQLSNSHWVDMTNVIEINRSKWSNYSVEMAFRNPITGECTKVDGKYPLNYYIYQPSNADLFYSIKAYRWEMKRRRESYKKWQIENEVQVLRFRLSDEQQKLVAQKFPNYGYEETLAKVTERYNYMKELAGE